MLWVVGDIIDIYYAHNGDYLPRVMHRIIGN